MSATNLTKNLKLSQFVASDKPSWLGDVNGDNKKIDDGYGVLSGEISEAKETASSAKSQSDANTQTLTNVNSELENYGNRITALEAGGGTEQLEQRVNTLSTDVEALETRSDTFDEKITDNVTKINNVTKSVTDLTPRVKACEDGITRSELSIQALQTLVSENDTKYSTRFTGVETLASNAWNQSQNNKTSITQLSTQLSNKSNTKFFISPLSSQNNAYYGGNSCTVIYDEIGVLLSGITVFPKSTSSSSISDTGITIGTYDLSGIPGFANKTLIVNDETMSFRGKVFTLTLSKVRNSTTVSVTIKSNFSSLDAPLTFNIYSNLQ